MKNADGNKCMCAGKEDGEINFVYLKADRHVEITNPAVYVRDVAKVYCSNACVTDKIKELPLFHFNIEENGHKKTASILAVIAKITEQLEDEHVCIQNIGADDFAMSLRYGNKTQVKAPFYKVFPVVIITFFGSIFAIMTYNEDVDTMGVFQKVSGIMGAGDLGMKIMVIAYALGIAVGIIVFFNHFGKKKMTADPTPMEVEMEKYETDVEDTWIKESARKGHAIDVP